MVTARWPDPAMSYHVPFRLEPVPATLDLLRSPIVINQPIPQDLTFAWMPLPANLGSITGEKVTVEINAPQYGIHCEQEEGTPLSRSEITIPSLLISELIMREQIPRNGSVLLPVSLERVFEQVLPVPGDSTTHTVFNATIRLSHSFDGNARF
jgi:hypothetical protein